MHVASRSVIVFLLFEAFVLAAFNLVVIAWRRTIGLNVAHEWTGQEQAPEVDNLAKEWVRVVSPILLTLGTGFAVSVASHA